MTDFFESRAGLALTILLLSALGGVGLAWFGGHVIQLVSGLIQKDEIIRFDKGAIYMLGGGIVITALLAAAIPKVFFQKDLSKTIVDVLVRCLLAGFATMITLPHLVHLGVSATLKSQNYVVCHELGSRWLMHVTFVYANSPEMCEQELVQRELRRRY